MQRSYFISILITLSLSLYVESRLKGPYRLAPIVRRVITSPNLPKPVGPESQAIQVGNTLYIGGNIGVDPATGELVPGGIGPQATQSIL